MTVIKKAGKKEEFSPEKLAKSLEMANQGTGEDINVNDLSVEFYRIVEGKAFITSHQIDILIYGLLYYYGFAKTLESYISYDSRESKSPTPFSKA